MPARRSAITQILARNFISIFNVELVEPILRILLLPPGNGGGKRSCPVEPNFLWQVNRLNVGKQAGSRNQLRSGIFGLGKSL